MINTHFVIHFIKHYLSATRIDVLHSPFVFDLYNSCIARQPVPKALAPIEQLRKASKSNNTRITQLDLGAKGMIKQQKQHSVAYFTRKHAKPSRIAYILYHMVQHFQYQTCIEMGTSLGFTSMCIAQGLPANGFLHTLEGAPEIAKVAQHHFQHTATTSRIRQHIGNFDDTLPPLLQSLQQVDFAFIDGNHTYEATMRYFHHMLPHVHNNSVLVFDDIYWSEGMTRAWEEIKQHPDVRISVDLFYIGLIYFRTEQAREHFKLRIW